MSRVHIVGAGFSGLSMGYYLTQLGMTVEIFEKSQKLGGLIETELTSWGLVERAANGLMNDTNIEELFSDLNIKFASRPAGRVRRYIFRDRVRQWPLSVLETFRFIFGVLFFALTPKRYIFTKYRTVEKLTKTFFGDAAFDFLIAPALQGIYGTSDLDAELLYQSFKANRSFAYKSKVQGTVSPELGMSELLSKMAQRIISSGGAIHLGVIGEVRRSHPTVIATSAVAASLLLVAEAPEVSRELLKVEYLPLTSVSVGFKQSALKHDGFGCLFPLKQKFNALGVLFNNSIFLNRSNILSETWIFNTVDFTDSEIIQKIKHDRKKITGKEEIIEHYKISKWPHALPHYNSQLLEVIKNIKLPNKIYLTGNYMGQLGLTKILRQNKILAEKIWLECL